LGAGCFWQVFSDSNQQATVWPPKSHVLSIGFGGSTQWLEIQIILLNKLLIYKEMAHQAGFEPTTPAFGVRSQELS
jgi:hypothetical protein